ncbi:MAG: Sigma-70, region 4 [Pelotomaculum sp. PtaU1.Bin065]|nr:MAG: Sigma-70, region 4 [Pelotomaculum sp. PtaU1.Bin065]
MSQSGATSPKQQGKRVALGGKAVSERRMKVMRLRYVKKWPVEEIARALGVSPKTISRDEQFIQEYGKACGGDLMAKAIEQLIWEFDLNYRERQMERYIELGNCQSKQRPDPKDPSKTVTVPGNPALRRRILNDIAEEDERYIKVMQSIGAVPKVPDKIETREVESWADLAKRAAEVVEQDGGDNYLDEDLSAGS